MISPVKLNKISKTIEKGINAAANSKIGKWAFSERAGEIAATVALASTTTKDAVNCVYYTKQSLKNDKIPEENRKFVAAIDLANGILNVVSQLTLGVMIKNRTPQMFDYLMKNTKLTGGTLKAAKNGFSILVTLIFAQVLLKRVLTPFLATPIASKIREYADKKGVGNAENKEKSAEDTDKTQQESNAASNGKINITQGVNEVNPTFKAFESMLKK